MNFLQFTGAERRQTDVDAWFENLLRQTTTRDERQACEAFECLLRAGSHADSWYLNLPDTTKSHWPSLTAAFHATWPVSSRLLLADRVLHARRMDRQEELARRRDEERVTAAQRAVENASEEEDYMWWAYLEEKKRLALDARREAAFDEDWAEFEEWERSAQVAREEDERVQREYEAQEIVREEEDLAWQVQEEQLDEDWKAMVAAMETEGRRAAVELGIVRVLRVKEVLRAEAEVEDRRRRQEATRQRTTARCVRHPLYTTPTTLATLSAPPNTTVVAYPLMLETIVADVLEPTVKKPPDGSISKVIARGTLRESVRMGRGRFEREGVVNVRVKEAIGPASHSQRDHIAFSDRRREIVVLPPTKHPTTITWIAFVTSHYPLSFKHDRPRSVCFIGLRIALQRPNDRLALTKHPTTHFHAWFIAITSISPSCVHVIMRSARLLQPPPNGERPTLTKHPTTILGIALIAFHSPFPSKRDWPRSFHFIGPRIAVQRPSNDRPALTKRPTGWLSVVAVVCMRVPRRVDRSLRSFGSNEPPIVVQSTYNDGQPRSIEYPASEPIPPAYDHSTVPATSTVACSTKRDRPARIKHPTTRKNASSFIVSTTPPSTSDLTRLPDVVQPLVLVDRPAAVKHPTTRQDTLPTPALSNVPFTRDDTRSALLVRSSADNDHPAAAKHGTTVIPVDSVPHPRPASPRYNRTRSLPIREFYAIEQSPYDGERPPATKHPATRSLPHSILVSLSLQSSVVFGICLLVRFSLFHFMSSWLVVGCSCQRERTRTRASLKGGNL
ncbi:hypothetical protein BOTBODRAFT_35010 [Botryobasidium botryosum FD-172 SS1]|uniref:Uncharacterized protein n=1 Tax=Botryobasidium botryosum (strain FD-172 SS1) TaxID=930990 RepID=A0A067M853_BOTB1|nr:hypothetical protein BOTBODRAFT_35010 [Botryobasidium botryosum FD-172 SS1]